MLLNLILLLTLVPIAELFVILRVHDILSEQIGSDMAFAASLGTILLTGMVGAYLARNQGFSVLQRVQNSMNQGQIPAKEIGEGVLILFGGALLLTPGYLTDMAGFAMILPFTRPILARAVQQHFSRQMAKGQVTFYSNMGGGFRQTYSTNPRQRRPHDPEQPRPQQPNRITRPDVIDAEYYSKD